MRKIILTVPTLADIKAALNGAQAKIEQRRARRAALDALIASAVAKAAKEKS